MTSSILTRYQQAQQIVQGMLTNKLVKNSAVFPHWISSKDIKDGNFFWYQRDTEKGREFRLVNASTGENMPAFDHKALADTLSIKMGARVCPQDLPLSNLTINLYPLKINFQVEGKSWLFEADKRACFQVKSSLQNIGTVSPDGKKSVFVRDYNLWIQDRQTGEEEPLTKDGVKDNYYSKAPLSGDIQAIWSPDSQRIMTHQLDSQSVTARSLIVHIPQDGSLRPQLETHKMAYPGDEAVEAYRLLSIDINTKKAQAIDYDTLPFYCMGQGFFTEEKLAWWASDSQRAFFVDIARGAKTVRLVELNTQTGATRILFEETSDTFVKISHSALEYPVFYPLPSSDELIWLSERTGWAHLYLYDLNSGELKQTLTEGPWLVRKILHVDAKRREALIQTAGRDPSISPYYRDICRLNLDTGELTPLVSGDYEYNVYGPEDRQVAARAGFGIDSADVNGLSPHGDYLVTTYSRVDTPPVSILIDRQGREILTLETADISGLPQGWQWPEPVKVKAADGKTDIYGVVYRPPNFSKDQAYPIIDFSCGHPYFSWVPQGSFINGPCFDAPYLYAAAYAALGFVVVALEGRGTPYRDKAFQDYSYGHITSASAFEDRIEGIHQLASRYPYMDTRRVGIAADDGSPAPVQGLLEHPDFYKVGVSICHEDPRFGFATLYEQYQGLNDGAEQPASAEDLAPALKGKLLLIHGMLDSFTPVTGTIRLLDALQEANKDFDMLLLPDEGHDIPSYALRRSWDYLVTHLQDIEPPYEFSLTTGLDLLLDKLAKDPA